MPNPFSALADFGDEEEPPPKPPPPKPAAKKKPSPMNAAAHLVGDDFSKTFGPNAPLPGGHSLKWSGIALAPNGKLYCSPFTASKVLRIDPATNTTELIGDVLEPSGNIRWSGIAAAADGKLYCSPNNASRVLRIDPATDATELIGDDLSEHGKGSPPGHFGLPGHMWSGIAAAADGKLYCAPFNASRVLRIDPATGATELIGDDLSAATGAKLAGGWSSIVAAADGKLYCAPAMASRVLRIDPATGATELIGDDLKETGLWSGRGWQSIAAAADGKLYCTPHNHFGIYPTVRVLRIDPANGATELIGDNLTPLKGTFPPGWSGIAAAADGKLYCSPDDAWCVLRIDPATGATELIGEHHKFDPIRSEGDKWSGIAAGVDGTLYCSPMGASRVLRIPLGLQGTPAVKR